MGAAIEDTLAAAIHFVAMAAPNEMRDLVLRLKMDARRSLLLTLKGTATAYLGASFVAASLIPTFGWWAGLFCLPLSLAGAVYGRLWRELDELWDAPIVLETSSWLLELTHAHQ